ncbi:MAG: hypothetical protein ACE5G8_03825, partial [Anaerolineae bacterium]
MPHPKLLAGKTALVLNPAGLLELQICLTLALEGCNLVGIGPAQDELRAVQREIVDLGASFDGLAGNSAAEAAQICAAIPPPDFIINPVGVYAACPAPPAGQLRLG